MVRFPDDYRAKAKLMIAANDALMRQGQLAPDKVRVCATQALVVTVETKQLGAGGKAYATHKELAAFI
jgi:hypothetical protein